VLTLPYFLAAASMVAHTDLIITVPRRIADGWLNDPRLRRFAPPLKLPGFDVVLATHAGDSADAPIAWLRSLVRRIAR
jgi:DNA-binding transcriptional LysR family regulator